MHYSVHMAKVTGKLGTLYLAKYTLKKRQIKVQ